MINFAPILGYGDLNQGNVTIKRVYYVEGLNHNLFSVGQFCDADLEVAFRKSTCFVRDLQGNDLLTEARVLEQDNSMLISKKKALNIRLPLLEHLNRMVLSKDETALLLRLHEQCSQLLSFHYHFGLKVMIRDDDDDEGGGSGSSVVSAVVGWLSRDSSRRERGRRRVEAHGCGDRVDRSEGSTFGLG
ncbi:hypothetical protein Tco_0941312 [Tanacetum coccineum]|uniref:Integrase, catalytic region, zinc finger, CCHC-type, peptidase aspartic, catalytic n=1 Tax=Tanacetum coccineum TaxID=301880 RepID=A0ABQ5DSW4_9ASTR